MYVPMLVNADLHIHSPYSMAVSGSMLPENLISACRKKGITILGSGDALHPEWRRHWEPYCENDAGILIVPTSEVEDAHRVHHLILAEDFCQFDHIREALAPEEAFRAAWNEGRAMKIEQSLAYALGK